MTLPKYAIDAAARGAALLDRTWPSWWRKIRVTELDLGSGVYLQGERCGCILAQLAPPSMNGERFYTKGLVALRQATGSRHGIVVHGFDRPAGRSDTYYERLTEAWKEEIRARRRAARE